LLPRPPFSVVVIFASVALAVLGPWSIPVRTLAVVTVVLGTVVVFGRRIEVDSQQVTVSSLLGPTVWSVPVPDIRMARREKPEPFLRYIFADKDGPNDLAQTSPFVMLYLREGPPRRITASDPEALIAALKPLLADSDAQRQRLADRWESTLLDE
jgi:hypothetical protein